MRPCNEIFGQANGHVVKCTAMGDMPVIAKTESNEVIRFSFTNVRCVPGFNYTLLSVTQMWEEQRIDARFRDLNHLELPDSSGGHAIPYDKSLALSTCVFVSEAKLARNAAQPESNLCPVTTWPFSASTHRRPRHTSHACQRHWPASSFTAGTTSVQ